MATLLRMDMPTLIMLMLVGGALVTGLIYGFMYLKGGSRSKRIKGVINQHRGDLSRKQIDGLQEPSAIRQHQ